MKQQKNSEYVFLAVALMGLVLMSGFALAVSDTDDSGRDSQSDLNDDDSFDDDIVNGVKLRGDGSVDDNGVDSDDSDDDGVLTRLSDGSVIEVGLGVPSSAVTVERRDAAVQKALQIQSGNVQRVEVELEHGVVVWKVRIMTTSGQRADIRVEDTTGNIVRSELKDDDSGNSNSNSGNSNSDSGNSNDDSENRIRLEADDGATRVEVRGNLNDDDSALEKLWKSILSLFGR
jgi:uncharacterized membrane protein YkoI